MAAEPKELILELHRAGLDELDRGVVDGILACGAECVPLLLDVLHGESDEPATARALALLGEIGEPPVLPEVLAYFVEDEEDEDAVSGAADWAARRITRRHPAQALDVIGQMAETADPPLLSDLARILSTIPNVAGRRETLLAFGGRFDDLDADGSAWLAVTMVVAAMFLDGPRSELAQSIRDKYGSHLRRESLRVIKKIEDGLIKEPFDPEKEAEGDVYELCCDSFHEEEEDEGAPYVREEPKIGRNDACWCGSGKKYKKCHLAEDAAR